MCVENAPFEENYPYVCKFRDINVLISQTN